MSHAGTAGACTSCAGHPPRARSVMTVADESSALIASAGQAAQRGDARGSQALFEQAALAARAASDAPQEREACLGAAEMAWQVQARSGPGVSRVLLPTSAVLPCSPRRPRDTHIHTHVHTYVHALPAPDAPARPPHPLARRLTRTRATVHPQLGEHGAALAHYDRALELAQQDADREAEGMVLLGKGFALMSIGRAQDAADALAACKQLSADNPAQERFVADLLSQAQTATAQQQQQQQQQQQHGGAARPPVAPAETDSAVSSTTVPAAPHMLASASDSGASAARAAEGHDTSDREGADSKGFEQAVRSAFVRSVVLKETVVLVMQGSPSAAETPRQHAIAQV